MSSIYATFWRPLPNPSFTPIYLILDFEAKKMVVTNKVYLKSMNQNCLATLRAKNQNTQDNPEHLSGLQVVYTEKGRING